MGERCSDFEIEAMEAVLIDQQTRAAGAPIMNNETREGLVVSAARIAHEANRAYCISIGDATQKPWHEAPAWQHMSAIDGVRYLIEHPKSTPEDSHNNWLRVKYADGWTWGPVKDVDNKKHPCMKSYWDLPREQRAKDLIFQAVVRAVLEL